MGFTKWWEAKITPQSEKKIEEYTPTIADLNNQVEYYRWTLTNPGLNVSVDWYCQDNPNILTLIKALPIDVNVNNQEIVHAQLIQISRSLLDWQLQYKPITQTLALVGLAYLDEYCIDQIKNKFLECGTKGLQMNGCAFVSLPACFAKLKLDLFYMQDNLLLTQRPDVLNYLTDPKNQKLTDNEINLTGCNIPKPAKSSDSSWARIFKVSTL